MWAAISAWGSHSTHRVPSTCVCIRGCTKVSLSSAWPPQLNTGQRLHPVLRGKTTTHCSGEGEAGCAGPGLLTGTWPSDRAWDPTAQRAPFYRKFCWRFEHAARLKNTEAVCERKQDSTGQLRVEENSLPVLGTRRGRSENPPSQARGGGEKDTEMEKGDGFRTGEVEGKRGA